MPLLEQLAALQARFGENKAPKSCKETVTKLVAALHQLDVGDKVQSVKAAEQAGRYLAFLKVYLGLSNGEHGVTRESVLELAKELMNTDLLYLLVKHLSALDFEARKDAAQIFGATIRIRDGERSPGAQYVFEHPYIMSKLFSG